MRTPAPFARGQQIVGMPEHPCETIVRNGAIICQYEETEIRFYPEHAGLYLLPLIGEPFSLFGQGENRAAQKWQDGYLPVAVHTTVQDGFKLEETVFACLAEGDRVVDGTEPLINMVRFSAENIGDKPADFVLTLVFGSCFRRQRDTDSGWDPFYWKNFLLRNDIYETADPEIEIEPYPYTLRRDGNYIIAEGKGIVFALDGDCSADFEYHDEFGIGSWREGRHFRKGVRFVVQLNSKEKRSICYKIPYLPLPDEKKHTLDKLSFDKEHAKVVTFWEQWLNEGCLLSVPGTGLDDLWKAQTAATFILVDKQNKGSSDLYGGELYRQWAGHYPDRVLYYPHLSPTLYEFIWAQECAYWVMGMLDVQGYHRKVEEYFEVFFALQGCGTPGVHNPSILPDKAYARPFMGTTPHTWLNSTGSLLSSLARHYRLTGDKRWVLEHLDSIISACRWIKALRETTKHASLGKGYGLMPPGQSTDATYSSDHLQWYYTDIWTLKGLIDIVPVLEACGAECTDEMRVEAEDYAACFLRSLDSSILTAEELPIHSYEYDFSLYRYSGALKDSIINKYDEKGVPLALKDRIITRDRMKELGLSLYIPMSPQCTIPMSPPYLDDGSPHMLGLLTGVIDFQSDRPLFEGARFSGREIWEGIVSSLKAFGNYSFGNGVYPGAVSYIDYMMEKHLYCDEIEDYASAISFVRRYACDPDNHMMVEEVGLNRCEKWYQPCPFALSMANFRSWLFKAFLYEDPRDGRLVVGKAIPKEWMENSVTYEKPLVLQRASTVFGVISVSYHVDFISNTIAVSLCFDEPERLPRQIEIRFNHPLNEPVSDVTLSDGICACIDKSRGIAILDIESLRGLKNMTATAYYEKRQ